MISIADYFCSNTKEIIYTRNHFKHVEEVDGGIFFTFFDTPFGDLPKNMSYEDKCLEVRRIESEYLFCHLRDNTLLIRALKEVERCLNSGQWDFTHGFLLEILPYYPSEVMDKEYCISSLTTLFLLFLCYKVIVWSEKNISDVYLNMIKDVNFWIPEEATLDKRCRDYVVYATALFADSNITTQIWTDGYTFQEVLHSKTLFDALFYQMLLHIAAGQAGLDGYQLAECQSCHQTFKKKHGNQKFCPQCSKNSERVRAYKARKKEESVHAKKIHP